VMASGVGRSALSENCRQNRGAYRFSAYDAVDGSSTGIAMCHIAVF